MVSGYGSEFTKQQVGGLFAGWLLTVLIAGCAPANDTPGDATPIEEFYARRAETICRKNAECCASTDDVVVDYNECLKFSGASYMGTFIQNSLDAGRLRFAKERSESCLKSLSALSCSGWTALIEGQELAECTGIVEPLVVLGDACADDESCVSTHCHPDPDNPGTGLENGICSERKKAGERCLDSGAVSQECAAGLTCFSENSIGGATCVELKKEGEFCTENSECYSYQCNDDGVCASSCSLAPNNIDTNVLRHW